MDKIFFFFKQKTAYEMRIRDWSSDVCSSDLYGPFPVGDGATIMLGLQNEREWRVFCDRVLGQPDLADDERFSSNSRRAANRDALRAPFGRASSRERVGQYV